MTAALAMSLVEASQQLCDTTIDGLEIHENDNLGYGGWENPRVKPLICTKP